MTMPQHCVHADNTPAPLQCEQVRPGPPVPRQSCYRSWRCVCLRYKARPNRDRRAKSGSRVGFLGRGASLESDECCELPPQWGLMLCRSRPRVFRHFQYSGWPLLHFLHFLYRRCKILPDVWKMISPPKEIFCTLWVSVGPSTRLPFCSNIILRLYVVLFKELKSSLPLYRQQRKHRPLLCLILSFDAFGGPWFRFLLKCTCA